MTRKHLSVALVTTIFIAIIGISITTKHLGSEAQEVTIIETSQAEESEEVVGETSDKLLEAIKAWNKEIPADSSVILTNLNTGSIVGVNVEQEFISASIYKLYVAATLLSQAEADPALLDTVLSNGKTVSECLELSITISDEDCGTQLGWLAGWSDVNDWLSDVGLENTNVNNYNQDGSFNGDKITTAKDVSTLLNGLYFNNIVDSQYSAKIIAYMTAQEVNDRLPDTIPDSIVVAHKTGNLYDNVHDVGYISTDSGEVYSFAILTSGWEGDAWQAAPPYFQQLFSDIFNLLNEES